MTSSTKIAIIIPFYNGDRFIKDCISSIFSSDTFVGIVYIVDNSTKRSKVLESYKGEKNIHVIKTKPAIGFGRACNVGLHLAISQQYDVGIIMNQDAIFDRKAIGMLTKNATDSNTFGTVPISYTYDFSSIHPKITEGYLNPVNGYKKDSKANTLQTKYKLSYTQANGACVAFNLNNIRALPLFDPIFKMYGEDVELFKRMIEKEHLSLFLIPKAHIGHVHSHISDSDKKNQIDSYGRFGGRYAY